MSIEQPQSTTLYNCFKCRTSTFYVIYEDGHLKAICTGCGIKIASEEVACSQIRLAIIRKTLFGEKC